MESTKFYATKLEGLKLIQKRLVDIDHLLSDLIQLEDEQPGGDSLEEYCNLRVELDEVFAVLQDRINAVEATVEYSKPKPVTGAEVHASYLACLR